MSEPTPRTALAIARLEQAEPVQLLPARCRSPHPQKVAECGRRQGHPGSHQDGDVVWRSVGTEPAREIPDRVSAQDLARCVTALYEEGAYCGDCDFGPEPCSDCVRDLAGYALAVMRVLGMTVPVSTVGLLPGTAEHGAYVRLDGVIVDEAQAWAKASQEGPRG